MVRPAGYSRIKAERKSQTVKLARWTGSTWAYQSIEIGNFQRYIALAFDALGLPSWESVAVSSSGRISIGYATGVTKSVYFATRN